MARNVVATSQALASQAGCACLPQGRQRGRCGDRGRGRVDHRRAGVQRVGQRQLRCILWDGKKLHGLNSSGVAPAAWNPAYFRRKHGDAMPVRGWDTVTTPGAVAGWVALSERFGQLPFADLFEPAIELAERGHGVGPHRLRQVGGRQLPLLKDLPGFAEAFMPRGRAPAPGERFVFKDAGTTLRKIALTKGEAY